MAATAALARPTEVEYVRPYLYPAQKAAIFGPERLGLIEASTKSGKTHGCMAWLLEQAFTGGGSGKNYWWVAPVGMQADIAFTRMIRWLPRGTATAYRSSGSKRIVLLNGAIVWFKSGDHPDSLYGDDVYAAVVDEASRFKEEAWLAVRTTLTATGGPARIIGNVKGRKNWFYQLARRAEQGLADTAHHKLTAHDAIVGGVLAPVEVEAAKREMPERAFRELYLAEPSDDGGNPFGIEAIRRCIAAFRGGQGKPHVWGWDLGKSVDWTVGVALDKQGEVCRFHRFQRSWIDAKAIIAHETTVPALVDSTGLGDPVLEDLQRAKPEIFSGYKFTAPSKQQLMEGLMMAVHQTKISFPDGVIRAEMESFEYEYGKTGTRYCLTPDVPILTAGLCWEAVGSLAVGDQLLAFDEEPIGESKVRRWRAASVTGAEIITRPCYRVVRADGNAVICSAEHLWLCAGQGNTNIGWRKTSELRGQHAWSKSFRFAPHKLVRVVDTWVAEHSYEAGYLAAAFDGEGSLSQIERSDHEGCNSRLSFSQKDNAMAAEVRRCLRRFGFEWSERPQRSDNNDVLSFSIKGGTAELLRFLGAIRPKRLLAKFDGEKLGAMWTRDDVAVEAVEYIGEREVVALGTTTQTLIADGFASHNSAPAGMHDDCVMALSLAVMAAARRIVPSVQFGGY